MYLDTRTAPEVTKEPSVVEKNAKYGRSHSIFDKTPK